MKMTQELVLDYDCDRLRNGRFPNDYIKLPSVGCVLEVTQLTTHPTYQGGDIETNPMVAVNLELCTDEWFERLSYPDILKILKHLEKLKGKKDDL
jgi:hypothetical protein